jgi:hypothetical protein
MVERISDDEVDDCGSSEEDIVTSLQTIHPKIPKTFEEKQTMPRVYVILEQA